MIQKYHKLHNNKACGNKEITNNKANEQKMHCHIYPVRNSTFKLNPVFTKEISTKIYSL